MKKDREQTSFANIGSSSLLIIFLILCLTTFAILSLSSAKSDYSLSERLAEHKSQYYKASSKAEDILEEIDKTLEKLAGENDKAGLSGSSAAFLSSSYIKAAEQTLNNCQIDGTAISCTPQEEKLLITYTVPSGEKQTLDVALEVTDFTRQETYYKIKKWQITGTGTWEGDDTLNLLPIEKEE